MVAPQSGYHSYSAFALAFKQRMGKSVTEWKHET
jgi:AraC-like DNA-binding protein